MRKYKEIEKAGLYSIPCLINRIVNYYDIVLCFNFVSNFLSEFAGDITDQQIPHIAPVLLPEMLKIFGNPQVSGVLHSSCNLNNLILCIIRCLLF